MAENERLQDELDKIKRIAADSGIRLPLDLGHRRGSLTGYDSRHMCDRDYKRRKMSGEIDDVYIVCIISPSVPFHVLTDLRFPELTGR